MTLRGIVEVSISPLQGKVFFSASCDFRDRWHQMAHLKAIWPNESINSLLINPDSPIFLVLTQALQIILPQEPNFIFKH